MTNEAKKELIVVIYSSIMRKHGKGAAEHWLWGMTPFPFGLANEKQIIEGIDVVNADDPNPLFEKAEEEMWQELKEYKEKNNAQV